MKPKILAVDDTAENLIAIETLLKDFDIEIVKAYSGNETLALALEEEYALILIDVQMPGMDGFETIELMRQDEKNKYTPVIFISAIYSQNYYKIKGIQSGAIDFLTKPIIPEILIGKIKFFIDYYVQKNKVVEKSKMLEQSYHVIFEANKKLIESEIELKEINAQKDKLFSIIGHDLKNPFTTLIGITEMILEDRDDFTLNEVLDYIESIKETSESVYELLGNLLDWARLNTDTMILDSNNIILTSFLEKLMKLFKTTTKKKDIEIIVNIPENLVIKADSHMIHTVMRNIITNAIKFTPRNGKIFISAEKHPEKVEISVTDTGIGIEEKRISDLFRFDKRVSTLGTENERGTGLGLVLCKELVNKNGGFFGVESSVGKGSKFYFTLPHSSVESSLVNASAIS